MPRRLPRGGAGAATLTAAALVLTAPASLPASAAEPPAQRSPGITVRGGETRPVFSRADAVSQTVLIETTADTDRDGVRDRVQMRIMQIGRAHV